MLNHVPRTILKDPTVYEYLPEFLLSEPDLMVALGRGLTRGGGFWLIVGAIGHGATTAISVVQSMGHKAVVAHTIAELYPSLPTWWVPESIVGCLPAVLLVGAGVTLASMGKQLKRAYF